MKKTSLLMLVCMIILTIPFSCTKNNELTPEFTLTIEEAQSWVKAETDRLDKSTQGLRVQQESSYIIQADWSKASQYRLKKLNYDAVVVPASKTDKKTGKKRTEQTRLLVYKKNGRIESKYFEFLNTQAGNINKTIFNGVLNFRDLQGNLEMGVVLQNNKPTGVVSIYDTEKSNYLATNINGRTKGCDITQKCNNWTINVGNISIKGYSCVDIFENCYLWNMFDTNPWYGASYDEMLAWFPNSPLTFEQEMNLKVFGLLGNNQFYFVDCPENVGKWVGLAQKTAPASVISTLNDNRMSIQGINDAVGAVVNCDYFPVTINKLPQGMSADQFLRHIRTNINSFVDTGLANFSPYPNIPNNSTIWTSSKPLGAVISIKMADKGSVVVIDHDTNYWVFATIRDWTNSDHPVSGNREFGYTTNPDGSYTFYTKGVDRLTGNMDQLFANLTSITDGKSLQFEKADQLWQSLQLGILDYVNKHGGKANYLSPTLKRPDWKDVSEMLKGNKPITNPCK